MFLDKVRMDSGLRRNDEIEAVALPNRRGLRRRAANPSYALILLPLQGEGWEGEARGLCPRLGTITYLQNQTHPQTLPLKGRA